MLKNFYDAGCGNMNYSAVCEPNTQNAFSCKKKSYDEDDDEFADDYDDDYADDKYGDDDFDKDFDDEDLDIDIDEYVGDLDDVLDENGDFITDKAPKKSKKSTSKRGRKSRYEDDEDDDDAEEEEEDDDFYDDDFADFQDNFIPNEYDDDISLDKYLDDESYGGGSGGYYDDQY